MTFMHVMYSYQSRNQRYIMRKKINYLIEKYKHNKNVQKLKHEVEELRKLENLRASQMPNPNQSEAKNQKENTEITSETFVKAEMDDQPSVQVRASRSARTSVIYIRSIDP